MLLQPWCFWCNLPIPQNTLKDPASRRGLDDEFRHKKNADVPGSVLIWWRVSETKYVVSSANHGIIRGVNKMIPNGLLG